jgi:hypothetical protein
MSPLSPSLPTVRRAVRPPKAAAARATRPGDRQRVR